MQAPSGSNNMTMQFVVVKDEAKRAAIGDIYRQCFDIYKTLPGVYVGSIAKDDRRRAGPAGRGSTARPTTSPTTWARRPSLVIACNRRARSTACRR